MYGFVSGISDTNDIHYCPKCGEPVSMIYRDGTAECDECGYRFGVVEREKE